jgi:hypothetical protein
MKVTLSQNTRGIGLPPSGGDLNLKPGNMIRLAEESRQAEDRQSGITDIDFRNPLTWIEETTAVVQPDARLAVTADRRTRRDAVAAMTTDGDCDLRIKSWPGQIEQG